MFSEVRHAILPLALRKIQRRGDLERAGLLIESLAKHWRDTKPFELLIVSPGSDTHLLRTSLLHGRLAAQTLEHVSNGGHDAATALMLRKARKPIGVPWTEYSLYTSVAEIKGNLFDYHVDWNTCYAADVHLFSEQSCVWGA